jgi:GT2 family glycosyltransferase
VEPVTVAVATYGESHWADLAATRAIPSVKDLNARVIHIHGETLHAARNEALMRVKTDRVIFLDADDELEPGFIPAMLAATGDVRVPQVRYVTPRRDTKPRFPRVAGHDWHDCTADCLAFGNWIVIGACVPTDLLRKVGGFRDFEWSEDWDLWVRCWQAGATFERVPEAIYRAHVRPDSRNRAPERAVKHAQHQAIARANGLPVPS